MATNKVFSIEDGNLTTSILTTRERVYSDIDLSFARKQDNDIYKRTDVEAVKQAVKNILMTNQGEKPFRPNYGGNLSGLLFELISDPVVKADIKQTIISQIEAYEPRARVTDVIVNDLPDYNAIEVTIVFIVISLNKQVTITTSITRLR
jgi:phage baseplate assembly protein W